MEELLAAFSRINMHHQYCKISKSIFVWKKKREKAISQIPSDTQKQAVKYVPTTTYVS
jgi:hypothetical protein